MARAVFATRKDATDAGWVLCGRARRVESYRGGEIWIVDVSGPNRLGYAFALAAYGPDEHLLDTFGCSETVRLTAEPNRMTDDGAFTEMFRPDVYQQALEAARRAIDRALEAECVR